MTKNYTMFEEYDSFYGKGKYGTTSTYSSTPVTPRCYETHPAIVLGAGVLHGGSCGYPMVKDADVYVGLDGSMQLKHQQFPWAPKEAMGPEEVFFKISDGAPPTDVTNFVKMIDWLANKLMLGAKVHVGCIGGHGRTGMVLSALVKKMNNDPNAIQWVRDNYCKKAVETKSQIDFLQAQFGINPVSAVYSEYGSTRGKKEKKTKAKKGEQLYLPSTANDLYIPGTTIPRTKGPRDLAEELFTARSIPSSLSIWTPRLTNAK